MAAYDAAIADRQRHEEEAVRAMAAGYQSSAQLFGDLAGLLNAFGASADGFFGTIIAGLQGLSQGASIAAQAVQQGYLSYSQIIQAAGSIYSTGAQKGPGKGALSGAMMGGEIGSVFGPMGAAIGAGAGAIVGLLGGIFGKPEYKKVMEDVGKNWGVSISEGLAKQIEETEKTAGSRQMAELLNLDAIMAESGQSPAVFTAKINDLMNAVKSGAVDEAAGIKQLGGAFTDLQQAAASGDLASEKAMIDMLIRADQMGEKIPELEAFKRAMFEQEAGGLQQFYAGIVPGKGGISPEQAGANNDLFNALYAQIDSSLGLAETMKELQGPFDEMVKNMPKGTALTGDAAKFAHLEELMKDKGFAGAASGAEGLAKFTGGALDRGALTPEAIQAISTSMMTLYNQAMGAKGATSDDALRAILPELAALQRAQALGAKLTPDEIAMLKEADDKHLLPMLDVQTQQLVTQQGIRRAVEALAGINSSNTGTGGAGTGGASNFSNTGPPVKNYAGGGFVPPGVVQPALLHGGTHGEFVMPGTGGVSPGGNSVSVRQGDITVMAAHLGLDDLAVMMKDLLRDNIGGTVTNIQRALDPSSGG
jgi:hypothetical protein